MKKIFLSILTIAALASCKKNYTCSCTNTRTVSAISNPTELDLVELNKKNVTSNKVEFEKMSKKAVLDKHECFSTENTYKQSFAVGFNLVTLQTIYEEANVTSKNECTISK